MFNIDIHKLVEDMIDKKALIEMLEKKLNLSRSEAEYYVKKLIEGSINRTDNTLNKLLIEISERNK